MTHPTATQSSGQSSPLAQVMAEMPEVWRSLLVAHVADASGRCIACRHSESGAASLWPCSLHQIADAARRVAERQIA